MSMDEDLGVQQNTLEKKDLAITMDMQKKHLWNM